MLRNWPMGVSRNIQGGGGGVRDFGLHPLSICTRRYYIKYLRVLIFPGFQSLLLIHWALVWKPLIRACIHVYLDFEGMGKPWPTCPDWRYYSECGCSKNSISPPPPWVHLEQNDNVKLPYHRHDDRIGSVLVSPLYVMELSKYLIRSCRSLQYPLKHLWIRPWYA